MNATRDTTDSSVAPTPNKPLEHGNPTSITIKGTLKHRSDTSVRIALDGDDVDVEIPLHEILSIGADSSVPAFPPSSRVDYLSVEVLPSASITMRKELRAMALGKGLGLKPFVLDRPTQAGNYAIPEAALQRRDAAWFASFKALGTLKIPDSPPAPVVATSYTSTVATTYPTNVDTPVSTTTFPGEGLDEQTDTPLDEVDYPTADEATDYSQEA